MEPKRLFLLDAYALIFRAYYALIRVPRITRSGLNTSAIFGFVNTLEELLRKERPTHLAVCFDPSGPTFRHKAYENYKGEREATPEDIRKSIPIIKEIIQAYRIPVIEVEGFEADDVIGTLSRMADKEGFTTYMMTPDKDFGQLVGPNVLQYKPSYRGQDFELRGEKEVCERYGIPDTKAVIDLLALMGDKIDSIPGCPGVGEKTAVKLINDFGSVDNLLLHTDQLKGALRKKVEEHAEDIRFSKFLATIRTDVPLEFDADALRVEKPDTEKLFALFKELEFRQLTDRVRKRLEGEQPATIAQPSLFDFDNQGQPAGAESVPEPTGGISGIYTLVADEEAARELAHKAAACSECGIFTVVDSLDSDFTALRAGTAIALGEGKAYYVPAANKEGSAIVLDLLARRDLLKISHAAKLDYVCATRERADGADALENYFDITLAHYLLQPEARHSIAELSATYLSLTVPGYESIAGPKGARQPKPQQLIEADVCRWACANADAVLRLHKPLVDAVDAEGMHKLLFDVELPLAKVLADMEINGVLLDVGALNDAAATLTARMEEVEKKVHELAGMEFNVSSPAKVGEILFDRLGLEPRPKKTRTGQYSTSEDVLEKVAPSHPIASLILEYRQLKKLINTYLTALPAAIDPNDGRVHTTYNQAVTATGRISSTNPNMQNIPVRDDLGREIRRAFIAPPGCLFLSADYSQIELRLVADFSGDETMLDAFAQGKDIHAITASKIYHEKLEDVDASQRRKAKTANFGILYGISAFGLSTRLRIPRAEAKMLIDGYFATFPKVKQYMDSSIEHARQKGYVTTPMGRKRMLPDINSRNPVVRGYAERNAINAPLQGFAADIIKVAMVAIAGELKMRGLRTRMIMQVHDELNFEVPAEELSEVQELVSRLMEGAYKGRVKLEAGSGVAANWLDAH